jgi:YidC/Oxa1 family membrane protein insertase
VPSGAGEVRAPVPGAPGIPPVPTAPVESLVVTDSLSRWVFTNRGAGIVSVQLEKYARLGGDSGRVQLLRDDEILPRYHLFLAGDTIPLGDIVFSTDVTRRADGSIESILYTGDVPVTPPSVPVRLTMQYSIAGGYVVRVTGTVEGAVGPVYMISQLPTGLRTGEANPQEDLSHYAVAYKRAGGDVHGEPFHRLDPRETHYSQRNERVDWAAVKSKYFIVGLLKPESDSGFLQVELRGGPRTTNAATHVDSYVLDDISQGRFTYDIYAGPQEFRRMSELGRDFQNSNPYGGWLQGVVQPFAVLVMRFLLWLKDFTRLHYGWVLVIFGVMVRVVLWPLNQKAMRTTMRMQRLQPALTEIQTKYKDNPQKQQEEIMRIYKEHGMTPLSPLAGCLPMLIPMPVLFALFFVFQNTIEFRGVPFLWLPDISLKDPYYIVPLFMGASMLLTSWMGARGAPQTPQTKMLMYLLPGVFTIVLLNFASGLNLYYTVQNVAALPQQWLISRERARAASSSDQKAGAVGRKKGAGPPGT